MRIISATITTTTMRTSTMTAKTMVTVVFLFLVAIFTASPYSSSSSSSSFVLLVQAQEYDNDANANANANAIPDDNDPIAKIRQQQYEKVLGTPKDQQQQQSLCVKERILNKECRNEMLSRYGDEEDANDTRQSKFILYGTEKELRNYCLELSHLMSQCKIKGIYHSTLDREQNAENDSDNNGKNNGNDNDNTITNQLGETVLYGKSPKQIKTERIESEKVALELSEWRWNIGLRGMMIVIILYALSFDAPFTKDNNKVVVPTTTAAAAAAAAANDNDNEEKEKEEELKDPTDKKKD